MKKMMAVYDTDTRYAERLSDYVNRKEKGVFTAQAFTSKEKLAEYAKKHEIDVLLSGERTDSGDISGIPSAQKIYMSEETEKQMDSGKEIYKFQSGDDIIREVMAVYSEIPGIRANVAGSTDQSRRIIGVYSPIGRCGKTCLALAIGQVLAKEEKVLFVTLDTFVIARVETTLEAPQPTQTPSVASAEPIITENSYQDAHISIQIDTRRLDDTTVYIADVTLSSPEYLKTALAQNAYGKNVTETTSAIAARQSAILAINGDYYGSRERGYVLRNGTLYRSTAAADQEDLVIFSDGSFAVIDEGSISADSLLQQGATQVLSFGPALVADGEITVSQKDEVGKAMVSNPRTAIGVVAPLHYLFVVSDGRTSQSAGLSLYELAQLMQSLGAQTAYNLDGGGSSTLYFNGTVVNNPTTNGRRIQERSVSDIVYIGY